MTPTDPGSPAYVSPHATQDDELGDDDIVEVDRIENVIVLNVQPPTIDIHE